MKKWILIFGLCFLLCACSESTNEECYYDFHKKIANIKSYTCKAYMTVHNNKSSKKYILKHYFKSPNYYKLTVLYPENIKNKETIYKEDKILIRNVDLDDEYKLTYNKKENKYLFAGDFIGNILENENLLIDYDKEYIILTTSIRGNDNYFNKERLYVEKKTLKPFKLEILDIDKKIIFDIVYKDFKYDEGGL